MTHGFLLLCGLIGAAVSAFFLALSGGFVNGSDERLPAFCRMDEGTCARVVRHRDARLLGLPNAVPGLLFYAAVAAYAIGLLPDAARPFLTAAAGASVVVGVYLVYALVAKLRTACVLCYIAHGVNLAILACLLVC